MSKTTQAELFTAETTWFHIFREMVESGDVAKMGPHATTVYMVIKAHTNFSTGRAFPAIETIVQKSGVSEKEVKRSLIKLEEFGYIIKEKKGRNNIYTLREKVTIKDEQGLPEAVASWDYIPTTVRDAVAELRNMLVTGNFAGAKIINIEHLNVQFVNGPGVQIGNIDLKKLPDEIRKPMEELLQKAATERKK